MHAPLNNKPKNRQMIEFDLDKQTIKDLEIFAEKSTANSISKFYNQTKTFGGKSKFWISINSQIR